MVIRKKESGIRINYLALARLFMQVVTLIGGNTTIIRRKDMEHLSGKVERVTLGSGCRMSNKDMEFTDGQVENYIKVNGNKIKEKVMHIRGGQMEMSIMDITKMIKST